LIWWSPSACVRLLPPAHQSRLCPNAACGRDFHLSLHGIVRSKPPFTSLWVGSLHAPRQSGCSFPPVRFKNNKLRAPLRLTGSGPPPTSVCTAERFRPRPPVPPAVATCKELSSSSPTLHPCGLAAWTPPAGSLDMRSTPAAKSTYRFIFDKTKLRFASHDRIPATADQPSAGDGRRGLGKHSSTHIRSDPTTRAIPPSSRRNPIPPPPLPRRSEQVQLPAATADKQKRGLTQRASSRASCQHPATAD
jgi:hypothetical protein